MIESKEIFDTLLGIIITIIGFFAKHVHNKAEETQKDLAAFKTHIAENYTHNSRIDEIKNDIAYANKRLDMIYDVVARGKNN
jgi:DNA-binding transcriptional regulator GbsR (MarR family)